MPLFEKIRQSCCAPVFSFSPTSNDRNAKTLAEAEKYSKSIKKLEKHVKDLEGAIGGMLKEAEGAYTKAGPVVHDLSPALSAQLSSEEGKILTKKQAKAAPVLPEASPDKGRASNNGVAEIADIRSVLEARLRLDVYGPADKWLADYDVAKVHFKELETLRLQLDAQRRTHGAIELKKVKQERNKGAPKDNTLMQLENKTTELEALKLRYRDKEAAMFDELNDLIGRAGLLRDCIVNAFEVGGTVMARAASSAPPPLPPPPARSVSAVPPSPQSSAGTPAPAPTSAAPASPVPATPTSAPVPAA